MPGRAEHPGFRFRSSSRILRERRNDLETLLAGPLSHGPWFGIPADVVNLIGPESDAARAGANAQILRENQLLALPGPILGYHPAVAEPCLSYFFSGRRLGEWLVSHDAGDRTAMALDFAGMLRRHRLLRYNHLPEYARSDWQIASGPFVLVDLETFGGGLDEADLADFLPRLRHEFPDRQLVFPAGSLSASVAEALGTIGPDSGDVRILPAMNLWPAIEEAEAIAVKSGVTGLLGLIAAKPVHAYAPSPYAGRGLTVDHFENRDRKTVPLEQTLAEIFCENARYLDMHERVPVSPLVVADQLVTMREQRGRIAGPVFTGGLSPWKRRALDPFLIGPSGKAHHFSSLEKAAREASLRNGTLAVWGSKTVSDAGCPVVRFEDGFIRSRGLGVNLAYPCSLAADGTHMYYDARGESGLEHILANADFPAELLERSASLTKLIVEKGVSKYNVGADANMPEVDPGRLKILVPGQVEKDASIRFGSPEMKTNRALVGAVRRLYPDAFIVYKAHPDVVSGLRSGGDTPDEADLIATGGDIMQWIGWCDRVETMTSLTGFEALLRGRPVGVHGIPFFAGWGLTDDRIPIERRKRVLTLDMLVAGTLILYPFYIHPLSALSCSPEDLVREIARNRRVDAGPVQKLTLAVTRLVNRFAVKLRDGKIDN